MNLQQLRYLVALADHGTMTAAADAVPVAQPVVSRALRGLERELGVTLLRAVGRGVELTDSGQTVVAMARTVLDGVDGILAVGRTHAEHVLVRIGAVPAVEELFAHQILDAAAAQPLFDVSFLTIIDNEHGYDELRRGELDIVLATDAAPPSPFVRHPFADFELGVMCPEDHDLAVPVPIGLVATLPMIWFRQGSPRSAIVMTRLQALGIRPRIAVETGDRLSWPSLVRAGHGYAIVPMGQPAEPGVVVIPFDPPFGFPVTIVHRPTRASSPVTTLVERLTGDHGAAATGAVARADPGGIDPAPSDSFGP